LSKFFLDQLFFVYIDAAKEITGRATARGEAAVVAASTKSAAITATSLAT